MKYVLIFLAVFLVGFGVLHFTNNEDETPLPPLQEEKAIVSKDSTAVEESTLEMDTFNYKKVNGYYQINWKDLSRVKFEERFNEEFNSQIPYPIFHSSVKKLDGQKIQIEGYVIPFEETGDETIVILSAFPFTSCFFCGGAGAETVMDVQLKKQNTRFKQDAKMTFRGKIRLNDTDLDYLNYILDEAEVVD